MFWMVTELQQEHAIKVVLFFLLVTVAMIPGMSRVETIVALENMMPSDSAPVQKISTTSELKE